MFKYLVVVVLVFALGCDKKDQAKYVAKSSYDALALKYEKLDIENKVLKRKNLKLNNQNELLKHDLEKYKNGFKSMYE